MKIYTIPVTIYATAYIRAKDEDAAALIASQKIGAETWIEAGENGIFCGRAYDDPRLPDVSLSPVMTISEIDFDRIDEAN